jgi:hypothetical protein
LVMMGSANLKASLIPSRQIQLQNSNEGRFRYRKAFS